MNLDDIKEYLNRLNYEVIEITENAFNIRIVTRHVVGTGAMDMIEASIGRSKTVTFATRKADTIPMSKDLQRWWNETKKYF